MVRRKTPSGVNGLVDSLVSELLEIRRRSKGQRGLVVACFKDAETMLALTIVSALCEDPKMDQMSAARQILFRALNKQDAATSEAGYVFFGARSIDIQGAIAGEPPFAKSVGILATQALRGRRMAELLAEADDDWRHTKRHFQFAEEIARTLSDMELEALEVSSSGTSRDISPDAADLDLAWDRFTILQPHLNQPHLSLASRERQLELQRIRPIDLSPLLQVLEAFSISTTGVSIPMDPMHWDSLKGRYMHEGSAMTAENADHYTDNQRRAVMNMYDYLRCREIEDTDQRLGDVDAIIVPGGRRSIGGRLARAGHVLQVSRNSPDLILSGSGPGDDLMPPEMSEAKAMEYFLKKSLQVPIEPSKLHLEHRATSLRETAELSLSYLSRIASDRTRPLVVAVITAPYVLRRCWLISRQAWDVHEHIVKEVLPTHGSTNLDASLLFATSKSFAEREYAFRYYLLEFYKLIGGRAAGEF